MRIVSSESARTLRVVPLDGPRHRLLAPRFADHGYQQVEPWVEMLARRQGCAVERVAILDGDEVVGVALVRVRELPIVGGGIAYVAGGPLTRRPGDDDAEALGRAVAALSHHYAEERGLLLRVLPPVGTPAWNAAARAVLERTGARPGGGRRHRTIVVDLRRSEEEILAACSKYWRRNLRRSERAGFTVRVSTDGAMLEAVAALHRRAESRKGFRSAHAPERFVELQEALPLSDQLVAALVERDGRAVSGIVLSLLGDTAMPLVLATDREGLLDYAAYAVNWHALRLARLRGLHWYDLGGIDAEENRGTYDFKSGLRGVELDAPGPFEFGTGVRASLVAGAERLYRRIAA